MALVGKLEDRQGRKLLLAALADDTAQVRAEAALALGDGSLPGGRAPAHGPEGVRPFAAGAPGRRPGPEEAHPPVMFHPSDHNVELSEEEFRLLRDFIHEQFGLFFDDSQRGSLRSRLAGRLASLGLASFEDYYHYLRFGPQHVEERDRMATHLTNNETYFYREMPQLQVFADTVLKTLQGPQDGPRRPDARACSPPAARPGRRRTPWP